ncbi:dystrotelin isoform X1 [Xyrichtys novacula]|nr:dystrotelin isoform X1 [Xyrichtys novacula]
MKLLSLQKLCGLDAVCIEHIAAAVRSAGGANYQQEMKLNRREVTQVLNRMFQLSSQEVAGHVTLAAPKETCSLMFNLYDRRDGQDGFVSAVSLQTALIALCADTLINKYRALVRVAENGSGSVSRSGLRCLLQGLNQVPSAVQEEGVFGEVETAVRSCFKGVLTPAVGEEHLLSWLQSEPHLLLWLPTLYRLCVSQNVSHAVHCYTCKTFPITGLRFRCMKCVNVHVCQSCFLTDRERKKHKTRHPVLEFCTQPTWRESWSSLVNNARCTLLPRRYTYRESDRSRALMWAEPGETLNRAPPPSDASTLLAASATSHSLSSSRDVSHDALLHSPSCSFSSKALQTDDEAEQEEATALHTEVKNLQRDKWLLEKQLQAWKLTIQSDHSILEDRCAHMEVTVETLREHNLRLQGMLTQALDKMEAQQQANPSPGGVVTPQSINAEEEEEEEEEELLGGEVGWMEDEQPTPSPTMHQVTPQEVESEDELSLSPSAETLKRREGVESDEEEDCGFCSAEEQLQEIVESLRTMMKTDRGRARQTGERKRAELLKVSVQVGDSIRHLVGAVRTNGDGH